MVHVITLICRWLVLGAGLAVIVAWLLAYCGCKRINQDGYTAYHNPWGGDPIVVFIEEHAGCDVVHGIERPGTYLGQYEEEIETYDDTPWWPREATTFECGDYAMRSGWPLKCLSAERHFFIVDADPASGHDLDWKATRMWGFGWDELVWAGRSVTIPLRPAWDGLTFDAVLFGAVLWCVGRAVVYARGAWRVRRSLCRWCAYPQGAGDTCPECGRAIVN